MDWGIIYKTPAGNQSYRRVDADSESHAREVFANLPRMKGREVVRVMERGKLFEPHKEPTLVEGIAFRPKTVGDLLVVLRGLIVENPKVVGCPLAMYSDEEGNFVAKVWNVQIQYDGTDAMRDSPLIFMPSYEPDPWHQRTDDELSKLSQEELLAIINA